MRREPEPGDAKKSEDAEEVTPPATPVEKLEEEKDAPELSSSALVAKVISATVPSPDEEFIAALKKQAQAPFHVAYEIFSDDLHKFFAELYQDIEDAKHLSEFSDEEAERAKQADRIDFFTEQANLYVTEGKVSRNIVNVKCYQRLKEYFVQETKKLGLNNPLIFFDDEAQLVKIGYGPREFKVFFPSFEALRGVSPSDLEREYKKFFEDEKIQIIKEADEEFKKPLPKRKTVVSIAGSESELIEETLRHNKGMIVGEVHRDKSPKQFLIDNMPLFKSQGVNKIFMEHLLQECHQELLKAYLKSPMGTPMPRRLELYLKHLDESNKLEEPATYSSVVRAAKVNGIHIVAIESEAIYAIDDLEEIFGSNFMKMQQLEIDRNKAMNMAMVELVNENDDGNKYVAFIGNAHVSTYRGVPGVSDLLGSPNIVVHDVEDKQPNEKIEQNVSFSVGDISIHFDILYHRNPATKHLLPEKKYDQDHLAQSMNLTVSQLLELEIKLDYLCAGLLKEEQESFGLERARCLSAESVYKLNDLFKDPVLGTAYTAILLNKYPEVLSPDSWADVAKISVDHAKLIGEQKERVEYFSNIILPKLK